MAITVTDRGTGTHNTGATSFTLSPASNFAVGAMAVLLVSADNSSSAGSTNDFGAVTDTLGNTWTLRQAPIFDNGAASAGIQGAIYTTPQNGGAIQTGTVITVNFGSSPVAKVWAIKEVIAGAGESLAYGTGGVNAGATTGVPTVTTGTITNGDLVVGGGFKEDVDTWTGDADVTNGSWSVQQHTTIGTTTSGVAITAQHKVVTATATQTYNPTLTSADCILAWISITLSIDPPKPYRSRYPSILAQ